MSALPSPTAERPAVALLILRHHRAVQASAALMVAHAGVCGLELQQVKSKKCHGGTFDEWLKEHLPEISRRSAYRYLALAEGMKTKLFAQTWRRDAARLRELILVAPSTLSDIGLADLLDLVAKCADGATLTELYEEFGIVKKSRPVAPGGYHPDLVLLAAWLAEQTLPPETPYAALSPEQQAAYRTWESHRQAERALSPEQRSFDFWTPLLRDLESDLAERRWMRLPDPDRYRLYHAASALVEEIRATLPPQNR